MKLTIFRICKCAPWHPGGVDLVPGTTIEEALDCPKDCLNKNNQSDCNK
ncbi:hypothetical protein H359_0225 [Chlamydia ibidis 10-1398/6]|uniref:Uncharacterized protein n=2 Tax=Chlamydia ibidis TaxID=1405396 RepID=A0ABN0MZV4_9CHLA|nr:hypothetical protein H359_0225 [Chlamydia ibidis 10-1398/6]